MMLPTVCIRCKVRDRGLGVRLCCCEGDGEVAPFRETGGDGDRDSCTG